MRVILFYLLFAPFAFAERRFQPNYPPPVYNPPPTYYPPVYAPPVYVPVAPPVVYAPPTELLLLAGRTSLLTDLVQKPINKCTPIDKYVEKTSMIGHAFTNGLVTAEPLTSTDGLGFKLVFNSTTIAPTANKNDATKHIKVPFDWTIVTPGRTEKTILLKEEGFDDLNLRPATTTGYGQVQNLVIYPVEADGPLNGFFRKWIGNRQAAKKVPQKAPEAGDKAFTEISGELNKNFDSETSELITPYNKDFRTYFYEPFVKNGLLGGRLGAGSNTDWIVLQGTQGDMKWQVNPATLPALYSPEAGSSVLLLQAHKFLAERIAQMRLGGTEMTEVEAAELIGGSPADEESSEGILGNEREELSFVFDDDKPIEIDFKNNQITITFRYSELTTLGETTDKVKVSRNIKIQPGTKGEIFLKRELPHVIAHYDDTPLKEEIRKHILDRMSLRLKSEVTDLRELVLFEATKPLQFQLFKAENDRLTMGFAPMTAKKK